MQKNKFLIWIVLILFFLIPPVRAYADTYTYDVFGDAVPSQKGFTVLKSVYGKSLGTDNFSGISDIHKDLSGCFFIADSGNNRIVKINSEFSEILCIIDSINFNGNISALKNPSGVYCSPYDNYIYIADTDNSRIIKCDEDGNAELIINADFFPVKVISDKAGYIYALSGETSAGASMFDKNGEFLGYYGSNRVAPIPEIIMNYIQNMYLPYSVRSRNIRNVPSAFSSFDMDSKGFMYICSETYSGNDTVRKINPAGENLFRYINKGFGDYMSVYDIPEPAICDIDITENGYINCLDRNSGRIFHYDKNCRLIFITEEKNFKSVSAIESDDNFIYLADSSKNSVTVFEISEFGKTVHNALEMCNKGKYSEALPLLMEALERDGNLTVIYEEISNAFFSLGDYKSAMKYAEFSLSSELYNSAFEEYRFENPVIFIIPILFFTVAYIIIKIILEKFKNSYFSWSVYSLNHPLSYAENILWKKKFSVKFIIVILFIFLMSDIFFRRFFGLQFYPSYDKTFNIIPYFFRTVMLFFIWTVGNWSVCCLLDGKGTFKNICGLSAYAFIPLIIKNFLTAFLSHFLIRDEKFILTALTVVCVSLTAIMMFSAMKTVHQYTVMKTAVSFVLSFIAMIIIIVLMLVMLSAINDIWIFINTIYTEILYRK